jgi:hypothetical protein
VGLCRRGPQIPRSDHGFVDRIIELGPSPLRKKAEAAAGGTKAADSAEPAAANT